MASDGETSCANDPNFAAIYSFLKIFGKLHGLEPPTIVKLQEFIEDTEEVSDALKELHLKLLRRALKSAHSDRWEKCMIKFCHQQGHHQEAWEIERFSYKKASTQVKLKVLKFLLEFQFTCHAKFKSAVNVIPSKDLRLNPIGRDKFGCVYWLEVDKEANLRLYKEDQDDESWLLIARNREELVKVIAQLKSGDKITQSSTCTENEASSEPEKPADEPPKSEVVEDNEEEFLSPESESEHEDTEIEQAEPQVSNNSPREIPKPVVEDNNEQGTDISDNTKDTDVIVDAVQTNVPSETVTKPSVNESDNDNYSNIPETSSPVENKISNEENIDTDKVNKISNDDTIESKNAIIEDNEIVNTEDIINSDNANIECNTDKIENSDINITEDNKRIENNEQETKSNETPVVEDNKNKEQDEEVSEAIEEPLMVVTGEGNGADCESYFIGEEIIEEVMYFYGEGYGYDNDTGNPEAISADTEEKNDSNEEKNDSNEIVNDSNEVANDKILLNGEHDTTNSSKPSSNVKLKPVAKRSLKKPNDNNDTNPEKKKPCVRDDQSNSSKSESDLKRESSINEKSTTDNESPNKSKESKESISPKKNNVKKRRGKIKKKIVVRKLKNNDVKEPINSVSETDNVQDKTSIIEKRKSSVSSVDDDLADVSKESNDKSDPLALEEPLPPKKLRLDTTPDSDNATHSTDVLEVKDASNDVAKTEVASGNANEKESLSESISKRKKIKAHKGKFKRRPQNKDIERNDKANDKSKKGGKSLKRSLVETTSDKNKSESQTESDDDEPVTIGKRSKIKPKKFSTNRKKIETKLQQKNSTDESEEETLYSLAGKKSAIKKLPKKKKPMPKDTKSKDKKSKAQSDDSDTPVRQSRRIAQQKIKEEAERRHLEEVALRELKMIHKKKGKDDEDEEEWRASGQSSSEEDKRRKHRKTWRTSDSTGPEPDSDSDSPLFELLPEPELDYDKSDHEFSPESDIEEEPAEPVKRARTLQEEKDDGFCKQCGSAEQPEWILLCDKCDAGYHASCLKPLLFYIPQGDWFCPPCNHDKLISSLESELVKLDELTVIVEEERARKKLEEPEPVPEAPKQEKKNDQEDSDGSSCSSWSSASSGGVYRLRARRALPVSMRAQEYDRLISAAIKEEYMEPTTSAGNQGRGKDISTIIEAAEEEKMKAEREAIEQGKPVESKKTRKKLRKKPRKLNSLEVPSEDDDEVDEDFKDTGAASSSEDISSSADKDSGTDSRSSDSLPIRRTGRSENKKDRPKLAESSPEVKKKKKGIFEDSSSESAGAKEWASSSKPKPKSSHRPKHRDRSRKRDKNKKSRRSRGLTQYDAEGNVIRARVTYGGLSADEGENDWSPKHRTRQKKINYTEMPNTESEDEMHKSSGKHMPDSSDEFKVTESSDSDWEAANKKKDETAERMKALNDLVKKTAVVPLEKLPDDVTRAKTEELQAHLNAQAAAAATPSKPLRGKGSRGGRGSRGPRGRGGRGAGTARSGSPQTDDALAKLVGVKVRELGQDGAPVMTPNQIEREKKRQEREAKMAEKEAKRQERLQKKEEKEKLKEQKAKEREEKKLAKIALQESKRVKKEKEYGPPIGGYGPPPPGIGDMFQQRPPGPMPYHDQRFPNAPRLQVRAELRGMLAGEDRGSHSQHNALREGTLSVAGSPQPFKPVSEEPSIITRMPHMINQQYRGPMMGYPNNAGYGRGPAGMYPLHGAGGARQYPPQYYRLPPAPYARADRPHQYAHHMQGPPGGPAMHGGFPYRGPPPGVMQPDRPDSNHHIGSPNSHAQNLGPGAAGPSGPPGHLASPGHLGPPSHLNQLVRPPGVPNHGPQGPHEATNSHGSPVPHNLNANHLNHLGPRHPLEGPRHPMDGPRHHLEGPRHPLDGPRHRLEGPRHPMDGPPRHPMDGHPRHSMDGQTRHPMDGQPRHPMDVPPRHPMDGPPRHPMDGQLRHPMDGPLRHPMDGQLRNPMDGPPRHPMDGQTRHPMDGQQRHSMEGQPRHPMDGPPRHSMDGQPRHPMNGQPRHPMEGPPRHPMEGIPRHQMDGPRHPMDGSLRHPMDGPPRHPMDGPRHQLGPRHPLDGLRHPLDGSRHPLDGARHLLEGLRHPEGPRLPLGHPLEGLRQPLDGSRHPQDGSPRLPPNSQPNAQEVPSNQPGVSRASPSPGTSGLKHAAPSGSGAPGSQDEPPIKIKAEVKTEPEYRSPPSSPTESVGSREEAPRHPKMKLTDNKDRRPRFPLGPYAPQYAPYAHYAPHAPPPHYAPEHHTLQQYLSAERPRSPAPSEGSPRPPYFPPHLRPYGLPRPPAPHPHSMPSQSPTGPRPLHPMPSQSPTGPRPLHPMPSQSPTGPRPLHPMPSQSPNGPRPLHPMSSQSPTGPRPLHPMPSQSPTGPRPLHPMPSQSPTGPRPLHPVPSQSPTGPRPLHPMPSQSPTGPRPLHPVPSPSPPRAPPPRPPGGAHLPPRSPVRSPGPPRPRSLTPPRAMHQPYAASPGAPAPYPYDRRALPLPIPRDSLPPHAPRRDFEPAEPRGDFEPPGARRDFPPPEARRDFEHPDPRRGFEPDRRRDFGSESPNETAQRAEADSTMAIKAEPLVVKEEPCREEGGVFGGLVSYFSSQHEDDIDT